MYQMSMSGQCRTVSIFLCAWLRSGFIVVIMFPIRRWYRATTWRRQIWFKLPTSNRHCFTIYPMEKRIEDSRPPLLRTAKMLSTTTTSNYAIREISTTPDSPTPLVRPWRKYTPGNDGAFFQIAEGEHIFGTLLHDPNGFWGLRGWENLVKKRKLCLFQYSVRRACRHMMCLMKYFVSAWYWGHSSCKGKT